MNAKKYEIVDPSVMQNFWSISHKTSRIRNYGQRCPLRKNLLRSIGELGKCSQKRQR